MRILLNDCIINCEQVKISNRRLIAKLDTKYYYEIDCESRVVCMRAFNQLFESGRIDLSQYEYKELRYA